MGHLERPVHLYVKKHNRTGLKYFGRTTENPYEYRGSGAYWTRHLDKYGDDVSTTIVGTYTDSEMLRAAAEAFSTEKKIVSSTKWANLLGEDGGVSGDGWSPRGDYRAKVAALDAAVARGLENKVDGQVSAPPSAPASAEAAPSASHKSLVWALAVAGILGTMWLFNGSRTAPQQPQAQSCSDLLRIAASVTRADRWEDPSASEFLDGFSGRCREEYSVWVDWQQIWEDAKSGTERCSYWAQFRIEPAAIELARRDGSCR